MFSSVPLKVSAPRWHGSCPRLAQDREQHAAAELRVGIPAREFAANTTELIQMLEKGHYGVVLDDESWERLATWIDLNAPCHGRWRDILGLEKTNPDHARRRQLRRLYAEIDDDPEAMPELPPVDLPSVARHPNDDVATEPVDCPNWPFDSAAAKRRQAEAGDSMHRTVDLGGGVELELVLIPAGE